MSAATMSGPIGSRAASPSWRTAASVLSLLILAGMLALAPLRWAAVGVLVIALSIAMLIQPSIGLILIAIAIPWASSLAPLPVRGLGVVDLLVLAVVITWLARGVTRREIKLKAPGLIWPLLIFVWVAGASLTQAVSWQDGLPEWLKWVEFSVLYVVGLQVLGPRSALVLVAALLAAGVSQAALGAYQFLRQTGPEGFILMGRFMRAYGTLNQPNPYAGYLGYLAPVAASIAIMAFRLWRSTRHSRYLMICALGAGTTIALVAGIFMSWSRGAWLGLAASFLVVVSLANKRSAAIAMVTVAVLVLAISVVGTGWLPDAIESRVQDPGSYIGGLDPSNTEVTDENFSVLERLAHWRAGWSMFEDRPWLGVGIGNYAASYSRYALPYWYEPLGHAHNVFINFLAETGILGLGAFLGFWLAVVWTAARYAWRGGQSWGMALAVGLVGTWTYLVVHSLFDNLFVGHMQLQLALLLAALAAMRQFPSSSRTWQG
jgi:putative inorganic carbon (HCO3(-)) transporter